MVNVFTSDEFNAWYEGLDEAAQDDVGRVVDQLEARGVALGFPFSSEIKSTKFPLRELRIQSMGRPLRVIYAFDPARDAYLIIGGDKTGDARFYERIVREAETIWTEYLNSR
ncbi:MAG: type II toxin-antitoxin system RelE/ParE family toxin [Polyangiaceae bacterium]|nr:type II toxin-antitoxin system RelE/ParE family toxin [Polyangiaceae bacterium]